MSKVILSLFDYTGNWPRPYAKKGYKVFLVDVKHGGDVRDFASIVEACPTVHGILAAPPCTHFAVSGARHWAEKDRDGRTEENIELVLATLDLIRHYEKCGLAWWALENPVGRINKLIPSLGKPLLSFDPCDYGDPWTKKTLLWGRFNTNLKKSPVEPVKTATGHSLISGAYGGKSERTKEARSATPMGFARAFCEANP